MSLEIWIAYLAATTLILVIPGPTIILVISQAIAHGRSSVAPLAIGVVLGDLTAMTCSLLGLGALISTSAALFTALKWIGAVYLIYLGVNLWRTTPDPTAERRLPANGSRRSLLRSSYVVTALNPKSIAFFVAFLPQFVTTGKPVWSQLLLLGGTFLVLAVLNAALYALFACRLREAVDNKHIRTWLNRCGGATLIGAGIVTAAMQRSA